MIHMSKKQLDKRVVYNGLNHFEEAYKLNKHISVYLGHNGNWEWISGIANHIPHHAYTVYKPLSNKHFDRFMYRIRTRMGIDLLPIRQVSKELLKNYRNHHLTGTGFIADQTPTRKEIGYWTDFLNQDTPFSIGVEKITQKINAAVVFLATEKVSRGHYRVNVIKLFDESTDQPEYAITEKYARVMEEHIQKHPAHWLWSHRRWKRKRN
jgi:KDO2-lipid IV(A) lauroyltransferase